MAKADALALKWYLLFADKDTYFAEKITSFLEPLVQEKKIELFSKLSIEPGQHKTLNYYDADLIIVVLSVDFNLDELDKIKKRTSCAIYARYVPQQTLGDLYINEVPILPFRKPLTACIDIEKCLQEIENILRDWAQGIKPTIAQPLKKKRKKKKRLDHKLIAKLIIDNGIH